jgi:cytochrome c peroxidase
VARGATRRDDSTSLARAALTAGFDTLDQALNALSTAHAGDRRRAWREARRSFKRIEGLLAYYSPPLIRDLNGLEVESADEDAAAGFRVARGFQFLEARLFDAAASRDSAGLSDETTRMRLALTRYRPSLPYISPSDDDALEIIRLEVARVGTMGITGFDAAGSGEAIVEAGDALEGLRAIVPGGKGRAGIVGTIDDAGRYARGHPAFDEFNRLAFLTGYLNPVFAAVAQARPASAPPLKRTWPRATASVFNARGFDVMAYAPPEAHTPSDSLIRLGRALFNEPALSGPGTRSCASCHVPARAFTDGVATAAPLSARGPRPARNTPSLIDAAMQPAQFADGRRVSLEDQIADVLASRAEMGSSADEAAARLAKSAEYQGRISKGWDVRVALAAYIRSLTAFDAPIDRALKGDTLAIGADARRGFNLFMGRAQCGTCHYAPLFSGVAPPTFATADVEVLGVPARADTVRATVDADSGRGRIDRRPGLLHAFRTPSLRNVALTAPYMHNGVFTTLEQVVDFYNRGGGAGIGARAPNQTLSPRPLHLSATETRELIAFLQTLTDTAGTTARPSPFPQQKSP